MLTDLEKSNLIYWKGAQTRRGLKGDLAAEIPDWMDLEFRKKVKEIYFGNWCTICGHDPHMGRCSVDGCSRC